jgi:hypothetical protein
MANNIVEWSSDTKKWLRRMRSGVVGLIDSIEVTSAQSGRVKPIGSFKGAQGWIAWSVDSVAGLVA